MARVKYNFKAFREIRTLPAAQSAVQGMARDIADACGDGYAAVQDTPRNRARSVVMPETIKAIRSNNKHQTILRNVERGRRHA